MRQQSGVSAASRRDAVSAQASYPTNGRALTDDAASHCPCDSNDPGRFTEDGLKPLTDMLAEFPYVGATHGG
jgi:hypothetical protein